MQWHLILVSALRGRNVVTGIAFALYAALIEPHFVRSIVSSIQNGVVDWFAAGAIVAAMLVETLALTQKIPFIQQRIREPFVAIFPWMFHAALSLLLLHTAATAAGMAKGATSTGGMALIVLIVLKELYFLFLLLGVSGAHKARIPEPAADVLLFAFTCIAYSAVWKVVLVTTHSAGNFLLDVVAGTILFWMLYLPMILPATLEELSHFYVKRDWVRALLFIGIPALGSQVHAIAGH